MLQSENKFSPKSSPEESSQPCEVLKEFACTLHFAFTFCIFFNIFLHFFCIHHFFAFFLLHVFEMLCCTFPTPLVSATFCNWEPFLEVEHMDCVDADAVVPGRQLTLRIDKDRRPVP
eukprot:EG_transcript_40146